MAKRNKSHPSWDTYNKHRHEAWLEYEKKRQELLKQYQKEIAQDQRKTTLHLNYSTLKRLQNLQHKGENYDDIIVRLLKESEKNG